MNVVCHRIIRILDCAGIARIARPHHRRVESRRIEKNDLAQVALVDCEVGEIGEGVLFCFVLCLFDKQDQTHTHTHARITSRSNDAEEGFSDFNFDKNRVQPDTYGADFSHFTGAVVVVDLLDVPGVARGLDRAYAHLLFVVVVVALFLADEQLVAVTREVRRRLDDLIRRFRRGGFSRRGGGFPRRMGGFPRRELVFPRLCSLLGFLSKRSIGIRCFNRITFVASFLCTSQSRFPNLGGNAKLAC